MNRTKRIYREHSKFKALAFLLTLLLTATHIQARVHTVEPAQLLTPPAGYGMPFKVAIDGDSIVAFVPRIGGRAAVLYRRNTGGQWNFSQTLFDVAEPVDDRVALAMKNNIAYIQIADAVRSTVWRLTGPRLFSRC